MRVERDGRLSTGGLIFVLIGGLVMGSIFTFGMQHQNASVQLEEAIHTEEILVSYKICYDDGDNPDEIMMYFKDGESFYIDAVCIDDVLLKEMADIKPGTDVELIVHPNSNNILDMKAGSKYILEFDDSMQKLAEDRKIFFGLGSFLYASAIWAVIEIVRRRKKSKF